MPLSQPAANFDKTVYCWHRNNLPDDQTDVPLFASGSAASGPGYIMPKSGHIIVISGEISAPITAQSMTIEATLNGDKRLSSGAVSSGTTFSVAQARSVETFVAGDKLDVDVTTPVGFLPDGTAEIVVSVLVEFDPE